MGRTHYMQDRVKIARRIPTLNRGIVENMVQGVVVDCPKPLEYEEEKRREITDWIPARLRLPGGDEDDSSGVKTDLGIQYELVMYAWDENGQEIQPKQHDELIIKYSRDGDLADVTARLRITGTIHEVRKRSKLYSFIMPVILYTEF